MIGPLGRQSSSRLRTIGCLATAATVLLLGAIILLGRPLWTEAAPFGIVSLQFATSPVAADAMLDSWSGVARSRLLWAHGLDLLLPVAYAIAIVAAATRAAPASGAPERVAMLAAASAVVAALADQVENLAMAVTILASPSWAGVLVTLVAATVKTSSLLVALGALIAVRVRDGHGPQLVR